jgi:Predicted transcriptional regulator
MSIQLIQKILNSDKVAGSQKMTLVAIAHSCNSGGYACLKLGQIAAFIGRNQRTVIRCVTDLENAGLLRVVKDRGRPSHFFIESF